MRSAVAVDGGRQGQRLEAQADAVHVRELAPLGFVQQGLVFLCKLHDFVANSLLANYMDASLVFLLLKK